MNRDQCQKMCDALNEGGITPPASTIKCPYCKCKLLWSEDRGAHCDGCDDFNPEIDLPSDTPPAERPPSETDLWNQPLGAFKRKGKRDESARGYASRPGSGPAGESCKTCKHLCRIQHAKTYLKCGLVKHAWTGGPKTDVRAKSPACQLWERGEA